MKKLLFIAALILLVSSCKKDQKQKKQDAPTAFETEEVVLDSSAVEACINKKCPDIEIRYLRVKGNLDFAQSINRNNEKEIIKVLHVGQDQPKANNVEEALAEFVDDYFKFKAIDSLTHTSYEAQIEQEIKSRNSRTVVFRTSHYIYTGGAHGYGGLHFDNYDAHTGKLLDKDDLIRDRKGFTDFVEEKFRLQYQIPKEANINATGFFFDNDEFALPENIAVTDKEVILVYNPYEAASYSEGQLRFVFPRSTVERWLNY